MRHLDLALAEIDLAHAEDGLAIFAAPGEHQVWSLARAVPERVVLSDTFLTRNLVSAQASERPFWVLSVSADCATLWNGDVGSVTKDAVHVPHGGLAHGTPDAVWQAVRPLVAAEARKSIDAVTLELESARGRRAFAAGVDEIWRSAREGRLRLLAVEENYR